MFLAFCLCALVFFIAGCYVGGSKVGAELNEDIATLEARAEAAEAKVKAWVAAQNTKPAMGTVAKKA